MTMADALRLFKFWTAHPPAGELIRVIAQFVGWKPPVVDLPASFEEAANENAEWFADPTRFFAPGFGEAVRRE
jgi:hypothetical protein